MLRAFQCATSGRPGPVVLALPEDVLAEAAAVADTLPYQPTHAMPAPADIQRVQAELARAQRPLLIVGGSLWTHQACTELARFAAASELPVAASFRRQDLLDNRHASYIGHLTLGMGSYLADTVRSADLIVALGTRLGDITTGGYKLLQPPATQRLVHIYPDPVELGRVHQPHLAIAAPPAPVVTSLAALAPVIDPPWRAWTRSARQSFLDFTSTATRTPPPHGVDLASVVAWLSRELPDDAFVTNGAGNYAAWVHRFFTYKRRSTQLAPTSGAMGYGLPAAVAAKLRYRDRIAVCFAGDGCFQMYPQELSTALHCGAPIIVIVINNGMYGTIRMHQQRRFPGRISGTELHNPDFVALARACGASAERVTLTAEFPAAFHRAVAARQPSLLELIVDPNQITPDHRIV
jgi:acetolactate synthase-1/2/3 large subunit